MAWKKVIVSGSNAELANITGTGTATLSGLATGSSGQVVLINSSTGLLTRTDMGNVTGQNTTYDLNSGGSGNQATINLVDDDSNTDTVTLVGAGATTVANNSNTITITSTNTVYDHPTQSGLSVTCNGLEKIDGLTVNTLGHVTALSKETIQDGTTGQKGVVQLSDANDSTSTTLAATANRIKVLTDAINNLDGAGVSALSSSEVNQLENIDNVTISNTQWGYLGSMNQGVAQGDSVTFGGVTSGGTISGSVVNATTANITTLNVDGSATMTGSLVFNGVSFTETAIGTITGSNTFGTNGVTNTQTFYGNSVFSSGDVTVNGNLVLGNELTVQYGGTGLTSVGSGYLLLGNGTGDLNPLNATGEGTFIVGNGSTMVAESGPTLRSSIGVGTADTPKFTGLDLGNNTDTTLTRASAGDLNIQGNLIYRAGGTNVPVTDGGTGVGTHTSGQVLIGNGTSAITSNAIGITTGDIVKMTSNASSANYAKFTATGLEAKTFNEVADDLGLDAFIDKTIATDGIAGVANGESGLVTGNAVYDFVTGQGYGQGSGDIGAVNAGSGLTGGGTTGEVTMSVGAGTGITVNADDVAVTDTQTGISSIKHDSLVIGRVNGNDNIDFGTDSKIKFMANNNHVFEIHDTGATLHTGTLSVQNLTVNGTTTTVNSTVVEIDDAFISLGAAAAGANIDSGIIFGASNDGTTAIQGDSLFWDGDYSGGDGRLGIDHGVVVGATTATAEYHLAGVVEGDAAASTAALADHKGNIRIDGGEIYMYV